MSTNQGGDVSINVSEDPAKVATTVVQGVETSGTTTFTNQSPTNMLRVVSDVPHAREIVNSATTGVLSQDVASFLAKPVPVVTGSLTPANLTGSLLFKIDIASTMMAQAIWTDKLRGFMNYRGTAKVRLQINANPFMAGRLLLAYIPQYIHAPRTFTTHLTSLTTITQLPHVEMSLQDTECELIIPYISPTTHYNVLSGFYDWGTVFCYVYSPLNTGTGSSTATYTAWLSFDDFEVEVPIVPQSAMAIKAKRDIIRKYRVNAVRSNLDSEINEGKGPISGVLSNISSIASTLYSIPMLSPIAGPTAWMSNLASGVASSFGWCKPVLDSQVTRVFATPHPYNANINEPDVSNNMGLFADNKVSVMPDVNLSGVDEMSINFVKRQKAFYLTLNWATTTLPGSFQIIPCYPANFSTGTTISPMTGTASLVSANHTPIAFLSKLYQYWRGSIEITIKVIKTEYHTGRLILSFSPQTAVAALTNAQTNYVHREVIDLRDGSEFVVKVPYCYNSMYLDTDQTQNDIFMMMHVNILNELVAPDTCSQNVDVLFEVRGGTDLEFQVPRPFNMTPSQIIEPQSGGDGQAELVLDKCIGSSTIHDPTKMAAELCIGESSTSLLQLVKRYVRLAATNTGWTALNSMSIYPYYFGGYYAAPVAANSTTGFISGDYVGMIAGCYAHSRGAVRYRVSTGNSANSSYTKMLPYNPTTVAPFSVVALTDAQLNGVPLQGTTGELDVVFNNPVAYDSSVALGQAGFVPMYSRTYCRLNRLFYDNTQNTTLSSTAPDIVNHIIQFSSSSNYGTRTAVLRAGSDDFHMSFWLGVPTMGWVLQP
jgi:hypothetical protein